MIFSDFINLVLLANRSFDNCWWDYSWSQSSVFFWTWQFIVWRGWLGSWNIFFL